MKFAKLISGAETGNLNTSPSSNQTRSPEKFEKPEKEIEGQFIYELPVNGSSTPSKYIKLPDVWVLSWKLPVFNLKTIS